MFQPRDFPMLDWWDARELDPAVQAARLADCNEKAAAQAAIFGEQPSRPARRSPPGPDDWCRYCRGKGHTVDEPEEYGMSISVTTCERCHGSGWS